MQERAGDLSRVELSRAARLIGVVVQKHVDETYNDRHRATVNRCCESCFSRCCNGP